jgi:hypothetical protein
MLPGLRPPSSFTNGELLFSFRATAAMPGFSPSGVVTAMLVIVLSIGRRRHRPRQIVPARAHPVDPDRPDVTNSSVVVPVGSVQVENGVNWAVYQAVQLLDGSETRIRGTFHCGEVLVDLPNYIRSLDVSSSSEFSTLVISAKRQLFIESPSFSLSVAAGVGVPGRDRKPRSRP